MTGTYSCCRECPPRSDTVAYKARALTLATAATAAMHERCAAAPDAAERGRRRRCARARGGAAAATAW
eukprot:5423927-Pyramimonas_sp.AAC.1